MTHTEREHSPWGASSAKRWMKCLASIRLNEAHPELQGGSSQYADEGTAAHELGEYCILNTLNPYDLVGAKRFNGFDTTEEMAEAVNVYVELVDEILREYRSDVELFVEEKFQLDHISPDLYGTNDLCAVIPGVKLIIVDYKHGQGVAVEPEENEQLMYYALGVMKDYEETFPEIELVIVQPRCPHPMGPVRRWTTTPERIKRFEEDLKLAYKASKKEDAPFSPGTETCRWCNVKAICPALREQNYSFAKKHFDVIEDAEFKEVLPKPAEMTVEEIAKVLKASDLLKEWSSSVVAYAKTAMERGAKIPGYKLVEKRGNRKWTDEKKVVEEYGDILGDEIFTKKLKTPAQLEKLIGKKEVEDYTSREVTGFSLVEDTSPKPQAKTVIDHFETVEDDFDI